jgi:phosphoribosylformimino-5-aminoimidazole carboxamide ribotide isomerase
MQIIPVIDLRDGRAVHGRAGRRSSYRPVTSRLLGGQRKELSDPRSLLRAYARTIGAPCLYVADLDRIEGTGDNRQVVERLLEFSPRTSILLDAGPIGGASAPASHPDERVIRVVATESLASLQEIPAPGCDPATSDPVLSLDLGLRGLVARSAAVADVGETDVLREAARRGYRRALLLVLYRVGTGEGLPRERLRRLREAAPEIELLAGGGIATLEDLDFLERNGFAGALIGTALHEGRLRPDALRAAGFTSTA